MLNFEDIRHANRQAKTIVDIPHPFVKWAGGKRQLLAQIDSAIPKEFNTYYEPFVGGGALFFYLLPNKAVLIDNNATLVSAYQVIKNQIDPLIQSLQNYKNESEFYYKIRDMDRSENFASLSDVEKVSRILYLNKCCYNGLYRVNSQGYFNTPFGRYKNPKFCDVSNLRACHFALQNVEIICGSFDLCLKSAKKGDFIYFDPPYVPLSTTANFTSYTKDNFTKADQLRLKETFVSLDKRGCYVLLSNSDCEFNRTLYKDYHQIKVDAKRAINSDASKRGTIQELLISNYKF